MKKLLSVFCILIFIVSLTGCSAVKDTVNKTAESLEKNAKEVEATKPEDENYTVKDVVDSVDWNAIDWENLPDAGIADILSDAGLIEGGSSSDKGDGGTSDAGSSTGSTGSAGKKNGGYNIEYEVIGYKLEGEDEITYYNHTEGYMWTYQMIVTGVYSKNIIEYWTSFLGYNVGDESYGIRPMDEPSGELEDWFGYSNQGEINAGGRRLYVYYDYDSPVMEDLDTHETFYFKRTSDKWEWTD